MSRRSRSCSPALSSTSWSSAAGSWGAGRRSTGPAARAVAARTGARRLAPPGDARLRAGRRSAGGAVAATAAPGATPGTAGVLPLPAAAPWVGAPVRRSGDRVVRRDEPLVGQGQRAAAPPAPDPAPRPPGGAGAARRRTRGRGAVLGRAGRRRAAHDVARPLARSPARPLARLRPTARTAPTARGWWACCGRGAGHRRRGLHRVRIEHLLHRFGTLIHEVLALLAEDAAKSTPLGLVEPLPGADDYLRVEVVYAVHAVRPSIDLVKPGRSRPRSSPGPGQDGTGTAPLGPVASNR